MLLSLRALVCAWPSSSLKTIGRSAVAAKMFMTSPPTARKWAARLRTEGSAGMFDRSSRPHSMPTKTPPAVVKRIVKARWRRRLGPVQIGGELGVAASTVHAVLVRCRINRLSRIDRVTGEPIRRYEHDQPGSLIHVDVTKFGNIPDGGGHKFLSRQQSKANAQAQARRTGGAVGLVAQDQVELLCPELLQTRTCSRSSSASTCPRSSATWTIGTGCLRSSNASPPSTCTPTG